jgi:AbiTii
MSSLVLQLQSDCLDRRVTLLEVLRKALVVSMKLSIPKFQDWIEHELRGYGPDDDIPEYRVVGGLLRAWNPYRGWIPVVFSDPELAKKLSQRSIGQAIGELENTVKDLGPKSLLIVPLPPETEKQIMEAGELPLQASLHITEAAVQGILDQVRTSVLNWSIELEKAGILGEGMTFSPEEKKSASHINYNVHFHQSVTTAQIQQGTVASSQSLTSTVDIAGLQKLTSELSNAISQLGLQSEQLRQFTAELGSVSAQLQAPQPNHTIIEEGLKSIRNILEGCAGSVLASALFHQVGRFLT